MNKDMRNRLDKKNRFCSVSNSLVERVLACRGGGGLEAAPCKGFRVRIYDELLVITNKPIYFCVCHPESVENEPVRRNFQAVQDLAKLKLSHQTNKILKRVQDDDYIFTPLEERHKKASTFQLGISNTNMEEWCKKC